MDTLKLIAVMTGVEFTESQLYGREATPVRRLVVTVAEQIESANRELERAIMAMQDLAVKIRTDIKAQPGDRYVPLNPNGELNGSTLGRLDATIVRRAALIEQLKMLVLTLDREPKEVIAHLRSTEAPAKVRLTPVEPMTIKGFND